MALTGTTLKNQIVTTLFGRRIGLDSNDYLIGPKEHRKEIEDITTTNPTTASAYGVTRISGLGSTHGPVQHNLPAPVPGVEKTLIMNCTSTASQQFLSTPNGAAIYSSLGTTGGVVNFVGPAGYHVLIGISSTIWATKAHSVTTNTTST